MNIVMMIYQNFVLFWQFRTTKIISHVFISFFRLRCLDFIQSSSLLAAFLVPLLKSQQELAQTANLFLTDQISNYVKRVSILLIMKSYYNCVHLYTIILAFKTIYCTNKYTNSGFWFPQGISYVKIKRKRFAIAVQTAICIAYEVHVNRFGVLIFSGNGNDKMKVKQNYYRQT